MSGFHLSGLLTDSIDEMVFGFWVWVSNVAQLLCHLVFLFSVYFRCLSQLSFVE